MISIYQRQRPTLPGESLPPKPPVWGSNKPVQLPQVPIMTLTQSANQKVFRVPQVWS